MSTRFEDFWLFLSQHPEHTLQVYSYPLSNFSTLIKDAKNSKQSFLADLLWKAIESEPQKLADHMQESPLDGIGSFITVAKSHGRNVEPLWEVIKDNIKNIAERIGESSLTGVGSFLAVAKSHARNVEPLWEAIESDLQKLAERAWEAPLDHVGSFLEVAKSHGRNVNLLWDAIESDPQKLTERAWETSLANVGSFLEVAKKHGRDTSKLWDAIESDPEKLTERAWETPLDHVGSFLEVAKKHGRDTSKLWDTIESDSEKLAERAWETSLEHIGSFLTVMKSHERNVNLLWDALERQPQRLSTMAKNISAGQLLGFCNSAPDTLVKIALTDIQSSHWNSNNASGMLWGIVSLAIRFGQLGRDDLKSAIVTKMLKRANPQDFPPGYLKSVAWLLGNFSDSDAVYLFTFLDGICTKRWLGWQYNNSSCGSLAAGLRMLTLYQPMPIRQRFLNSGLRIRLREELSRFNVATDQDQNEVIQLLGSVVLFGLFVDDKLLENIPYSKVCELPLNVLPHQANASKVDEWQYQLWLGLRAVASITNNPLPVSAVVINQTLDLWRKNFEESSLKPESVEYSVNTNMVSWLEDCSRKNKGLLPAPLLKST